jgi:hypothetical protein
MSNINKVNINKVKNGISYEQNGWLYVSIKGSPRERGYAYGKLIHKEMKKVKETLDFIIYNDYGVKWEFFIGASNKYYKQKIIDGFPEFYEEMVGFAEGCSAGGTKMSVDEVVAWNNYFKHCFNIRFWVGIYCFEAFCKGFYF